MFVNKAGLNAIGDNLYMETPAPARRRRTPGTDGFGDLLQGNLEQPCRAVKRFRSDRRAARLRMNAKVITATDQMLQSTSGMMR